MKKIVAVALTLALLFGVLSISASADEVTPVIMISGYASAQLYENYGTPEQQTVWGINAGMVFDQMKTNIPGMTVALIQTLFGNPYAIGYDVGEQGVMMLDKVINNPDGTSRYSVTTYPNEPELTNYAYFESVGNTTDVGEIDFAKHISKEIGGENVFSFCADFRRSVVDNAAELRTFVEKVKEHTGSSKVSLFGLSYGGLTVGTYLSLYGTLGDIDNAVMSVPALGGTDIVVNVLEADVDLMSDYLFRFLETAVSAETDVASLLEGRDYGAINEIARGFLEGFHDTVLYWGSVWDFMPADDYEEMKAKYLDPVESAELIAKSDQLHEIMKHYDDAFKACQEAGVDVSIHCSTGSAIALGSDSNADTVIHAASESGAKCAPLGERFADGYAQSGSNCTNPAHHHVSPSMEVDASYAYLPDNTWFVDGQYHGMYFWENYTRELMTTLLLTDEIDDVYSNPAYPQFNYSQHVYTGVYAKFNSSAPGYVCSGDTALVVKNLSEKFPMKITSITCDGLDLRFDRAAVIKPGESAEVSFTGEIPAVSLKRAAITVNYLQLGSLSALDMRTFDITILNGEPVAFDSQQPYADADFETVLEKNAPNWLLGFISRLGLRKAITVVFNTLLSLAAK